MIAVVDSEKPRLHGHLRTDRVEGKTVKRRGGGDHERSVFASSLSSLYSPAPFQGTNEDVRFCFRGVPAAIPEQMGCF